MSPTPRSTRREFLQGKAAVDALAEAIAPADVGTRAQSQPDGRRLPAARLATGDGLHTSSLSSTPANIRTRPKRPSRRSTWWIDWRISSRSIESTAKSAGLIAARPRSRFRSSAHCSTCWRRPRGCAIETAGAYDITAGPLSEVWGFTRRNGAIPSAEALAEALARVGSQFLELDDRVVERSISQTPT